MPAAVSLRPAGRVLITSDAVGGVWTYSLDLARGLAAAGLETALAVLGPAPSPRQAADARAVPGLALIDTGLPLDWTASAPDEVLGAGASVRDLARELRVDLLHLNSPALAAAGGFAAPVVGACHSCLATWWAAVKRGPMPADFAWRTRLVERGLAACDALIAPTHAFAEATARAYGIAAPHAIWNGREPAPGVREEAEPCVFTGGRLWDEAKNVAVLDAAAAEIRAPLYAAGPLDNPNGGRLELRHARPLGPLPAAEVAAWLRRAPVYATAARYEPFGLGVLEAAQAGCALVLSDIPTLRELWDGAALFVGSDDARGLARACGRLLGDDRERARLGARARARAIRYSVPRVVAGVLDVYRRLEPALAPAAQEAVA